jgi:hypothetical protein
MTFSQIQFIDTTTATSAKFPSATSCCLNLNFIADPSICLLGGVFVKAEGNDNGKQNDWGEDNENETKGSDGGPEVGDWA